MKSTTGTKKRKEIKTHAHKRAISNTPGAGNPSRHEVMAPALESKGTCLQPGDWLKRKEKV